MVRGLILAISLAWSSSRSNVSSRFLSNWRFGETYRTQTKKAKSLLHSNFSRSNRTNYGCILASSTPTTGFVNFTTNAMSEQTKKPDKASAAKAAAEPKPLIEAMEEDDEFEEFEPEHWAKGQAEEESQQWMDNWDDDMDDDFTKNLREELQKNSK